MIHLVIVLQTQRDIMKTIDTGMNTPHVTSLMILVIIVVVILNLHRLLLMHPQSLLQGVMLFLSLLLQYNLNQHLLLPQFQHLFLIPLVVMMDTVEAVIWIVIITVEVKVVQVVIVTGIETILDTVREDMNQFMMIEGETVIQVNMMEDHVMTCVTVMNIGVLVIHMVEWMTDMEEVMNTGRIPTRDVPGLVLGLVHDPGLALVLVLVHVEEVVFLLMDVVKMFSLFPTISDMKMDYPNV